MHFKALREAGLIRSERQGVEMRNTSRCPEIEQRFPGLIPAIVSAIQRQRARPPRSAAAKTARRAGAPLDDGVRARAAGLRSPDVTAPTLE